MGDTSVTFTIGSGTVADTRRSGAAPERRQSVLILIMKKLC